MDKATTYQKVNNYLFYYRETTGKKYFGPVSGDENVPYLHNRVSFWNKVV